MSIETHGQITNDIWRICNEYSKVILHLTVLRRFDCLLAPSKALALTTFNEFKNKPESIIT